MTDGTSQGLFIVVAIVIFGIFVVLAYILFEDTLSPAMANMFMEATEETLDRLVKEIPKEDLDYQITDGEVTITKYKGLETEIYIPKEIDGFPVTKIGNYAFYSGDDQSKNPIPVYLTYVNIPDTVKVIGYAAFQKNRITTLKLPKYLDYIGGYAFYHAIRFNEIKLPETLKHIGEYSFDGSRLSTFKLPKSIVSLGVGIVYSSSVKTIYVPKEIKDYFISDIYRFTTNAPGKYADVVYY